MSSPDPLKRFGYELLDLAHLLYLIEPLKISVQSVVMQALLKHAGFSHKLWDKADSFVGWWASSRLLKSLSLSLSLQVS